MPTGVRPSVRREGSIDMLQLLRDLPREGASEIRGEEAEKFKLNFFRIPLDLSCSPV